MHKVVPDGYSEFLKDLRARIHHAQRRAILSVNRDCDLRSSFPEMKGFSLRNLKYMRALAGAYSDEQFVQQLVAQIPWGHNVRILDHVKDPVEREWYIRKTIAEGWSRNTLVIQIESGLFGRQSSALRDISKPLGVSGFEITRQLPENLQHDLPTVDQIEEEL